MLLRAFAFVLTLALTSPAAEAADAASACKARQDLVDSCHIVHGRLMAYNGTPTFRIWVVGTKRLLGVHQTQSSDDTQISP